MAHRNAYGKSGKSLMMIKMYQELRVIRREVVDKVRHVTTSDEGVYYAGIVKGKTDASLGKKLTTVMSKDLVMNNSGYLRTKNQAEVKEISKRGVKDSIKRKPRGKQKDFKSKKDK